MGVLLTEEEQQKCEASVSAEVNHSQIVRLYMQLLCCNMPELRSLIFISSVPKFYCTCRDMVTGYKIAGKIIS